MPNLPNGSKGDSNPGSHDCESGILPLSYRTPVGPFYMVSIIPGKASNSAATSSE